MSIKRNRERKVDADELDITSLLDILVILLVFLLKSYNDSDLTVDLVNDLALPYSISRGVPQNGVVLQVNKRREVFINNKLQGKINRGSTLRKVSQFLNREYQSRKQKLKKKNEEPEMINFVFDQDLTYQELNKVMAVSSESGFSRYKLVVQGLE